ncbi:phosphate regulon sensor histidine kinase PhoR [Onishia niordana]|uniref:phosphate regulon sensor histidine kinase PhoR n=1 Tax=Onishia niordana TaxID=2508711 RepID=UPI00109EED60|nr:phosphate regulon sensor histidine kinase PhoR [Halomonas niordiana]
MQLWSLELWRLSWLAGVLSLAGLVFGAPGVGLAAGLGIYLAFHLRQLNALHRWLAQSRQSEPPEASGIWGDIFDRLHNHQKAQAKTQQRLRNTIQRIKDSSEAMSDSVVMLDRRGDLEWWNSAAESMLGLRTRQDRGQHITNLIRAPLFVEYFDKRDYREPLTLTSPIDDRRMLQCQLTLYGDDERLLMVRDITRLHRLEQMRRDFVANVSHELRTPLTVLNGYLETYADHAELMPPRLARSLGQMQDQTTRMQNLVDDLLMLSRLEIDQPSAHDESVSLAPMLDDILRDTESLSAGRHQVRVEIESAQSLRGDPKELRSAISNLAFNAVRYSGEGCHIVLRWRDHPAGAALEIEDDGEGIDPVHIPRLTERFYRVDKGRSTATGGTGLGLAIVKHVLLRHDARLEISSYPEKGAVFRCVFPSKRLIKNEALST